MTERPVHPLVRAAGSAALGAHPAERLASSVPAERHPIVLAPADATGWFGGTAVFACDPVEVRAAVSLAEAGAALEAAYRSPEPVLTAVFASYDGSCFVARYDGALVRSEEGWHRWGRAPEAIEPTAEKPDPHAPADSLLGEASWDTAPHVYRHAVGHVRQRIAAGDVYVLNLTAQLTGSLRSTPSETFGILSGRARAPFSAYFAGMPGDVPWIASVSPERFVRVRPGAAAGDVAEVSPIKGTRPRGLSEEEDLRIISELKADAKERAEHTMIVDLERNDLGVVCDPGTVHVEPLREVFATPYCHQMVSTVRGALGPDSFHRLLPALFPCGSVTGAPKRAAMRIIADLESSGRRAYCGALLVAVPGEIDSAVLIRTLEGVREDPGRARWGAGCGITHDSDPAAEYLELLLKATPALGDGAPEVALRETMRVVHGRAPLLDRHLARLASGGVGPTILSRVRSGVALELSGPVASAAYARLGVTVTPDGGVSVGTTTDASSLEVEGGPRVVFVEVDSPVPVPFSAAKPAARRFWDRAHRAAQARGADQAVLVARDGTIIDGSTATVWLVVDGTTLLTPKAPSAVAGVVRGLVLEIAEQLGLQAYEQAFTVADLESADEVLLTNAVGLVVPVRGRGGPVCERIAAAVALEFTART